MIFWLKFKLGKRYLPKCLWFVTILLGSLGVMTMPAYAQTPCEQLPDAPFMAQYATLNQTYDLGCPVADSESIFAAYQPFEFGAMVWFSDTVHLLPLSPTITVPWQIFVDTWNDRQPASDPTLSPPAGRQQPIRGFGKVWREQLGGPQAEIGWALEPEQGYQLQRQVYSNAIMMSTPDGGVVVDCAACPRRVLSPTISFTPTTVLTEPVWAYLPYSPTLYKYIAAAEDGSVWAVGPDYLSHVNLPYSQTFLIGRNVLTKSNGWYNLRQLAIAPNGSVWLATTEGLYQAVGAEWPQYLPDHVINRIAFEADGTLWAIGTTPPPTRTYFLKRFVDGAWQDVAMPVAAPQSNYPTNLTTTPDGSVWVAFWNGGLYQFDGFTWTERASYSSSGPENEVVSNRAGQVWQGHMANQSWQKWSVDGWKRYPDDYPIYPVTLLAVDSAGEAWGSVAGGCYQCRSFDTNRTGAIYISESSACRFTAHDGLGGAPIEPPPSPFDMEVVRPDVIYDMAISPDGTVWFVTPVSLTRFQPTESVCDYDIYQE